VGYTCGFEFTDANGNYHGIEWIDVSDGKVVAIESGMRAQLFPLHLGDLFRELMVVLLYEKLTEFLRSGKGGEDPAQISARVKELRQRFRQAGCHWGATKVEFSRRWTWGPPSLIC
jgi:hypothetical protein